ncbi:hypothetical protein F5Y03DRAFT_115906 [Xylaria venustula]|nr:hypothetical protein F5Y03DRAFT_115906 [Xylaria venustula]
MSGQTNPTHTTVPPTEGVDPSSSSPVQANTAVTTDGFKGDHNETTQQPQPGNVIVVPSDGAEATSGVTGHFDPNQPESADKPQQGGPASKLRNVFSRSKKGSEEGAEGQGKGDEGVPKKKLEDPSENTTVI